MQPQPACDFRLDVIGFRSTGEGIGEPLWVSITQKGFCQFGQPISAKTVTVKCPNQFLGFEGLYDLLFIAVPARESAELICRKLAADGRQRQNGVADRWLFRQLYSHHLLGGITVPASNPGKKRRVEAGKNPWRCKVFSLSTTVLFFEGQNP
jgi:hypothetical protein